VAREFELRGQLAAATAAAAASPPGATLIPSLVNADAASISSPWAGKLRAELCAVRDTVAVLQAAVEAREVAAATATVTPGGASTAGDGGSAAVGALASALEAAGGREGDLRARLDAAELRVAAAVADLSSAAAAATAATTAAVAATDERATGREQQLRSRLDKMEGRVVELAADLEGARITAKRSADAADQFAAALAAETSSSLEAHPKPKS